MTTLVIGGDRIDAIRRELAAHGLKDVEHWDGRKPADARRRIPDRIKLVVAVTDQLSHSMLYTASVGATRHGLPVIYTRRSAHELREKLAERYGELQENQASRPVSSGWALPFNRIVLSY